MNQLNSNVIRQGDVCLTRVLTASAAVLLAGCTEVPNDNGRIVLAYGEVTGHAHAIADHLVPADPNASLRAGEMADALIARAKAKLWQAPDGSRYLEVTEPVMLRHEEHTEHQILPGIWRLPAQVEFTPEESVRVAD